MKVHKWSAGRHHRRHAVTIPHRFRSATSLVPRISDYLKKSLGMSG